MYYRLFEIELEEQEEQEEAADDDEEEDREKVFLAIS